MSNGKVALVTGAGTGIGKAAAHAMLKDGYRVALVGRRKELLEKAALRERCVLGEARARGGRRRRRGCRGGRGWPWGPG